jgi:uncharacterized protein with von Willebrand factor type A (vWA) domain
VLVRFFYSLRAQGLKVSPQQFLTLALGMGKGLHGQTLQGFYHLARCTLLTTETDFDKFDQVFTAFFEGVDLAALKVEDQFFDWLRRAAEGEVPHLSPEEQALFDAMGIEELEKMFRDLLDEQKEAHDGGTRFIGTGGSSPFGHSGAPRPGFRIGGSSRNRRAMQVAEQRRYRDYRNDRILDIRQYSVALRKLRHFGRSRGEEQVDIDATIEATGRQAGELEVVVRRPLEPSMRVILLMDVGGTMDPFVHQVEALFSAASQASHFKEFRALYFHNCVYGKVYRDARFREQVLLADLFRGTSKDYRLIVVGDAMMAPYELVGSRHSLFFGVQESEKGWESLKALRERYPHSVWLNPEPVKYWHGETLQAISQLFPMYSLTLDGLEEAIRALRH